MTSEYVSAVTPVTRAWVSTGGTGAQNYDEFADDAEITTIIEANPFSALGVEMPHRAPGAVATDFDAALPQARRRLRQAQSEGKYAAHRDIVAVYRITCNANTNGETATSLGVFAMVDTAEISTQAQEPGRVIRNEDVFVAKVRQRVALLEATDHLLSAVLLVQTDEPQALQAALEEVCRTHGAPDVVDHDAAARVHEVWVVDDPSTVDRLCALAGGGELVVADGNHRSLAAQHAGLDRFLAVITTAEALSLQPYHRLFRDWPIELGDPVDALCRVGAEVVSLSGGLSTPTTAGTVHLYCRGRGYALTLPPPVDGIGSATHAMDHARVEDVVVRGLLGWDPADERISYVGGDYSPDWLVTAVDEGRADCAVLIAPVTVSDFVRVNVDRSAMPRKSTWFVPKARAGLVLAQWR